MTAKANKPVLPVLPPNTRLQQVVEDDETRRQVQAFAEAGSQNVTVVQQPLTDEERNLLSALKGNPELTRLLLDATKAGPDSTSKFRRAQIEKLAKGVLQQADTGDSDKISPIAQKVTSGFYLREDQMDFINLMLEEYDLKHSNIGRLAMDALMIMVGRGELATVRRREDLEQTRSRASSGRSA